MTVVSLRLLLVSSCVVARIISLDASDDTSVVMVKLDLLLIEGGDVMLKLSDDVITVLKMMMIVIMRTRVRLNIQLRPLLL